MNSVLTVRGLTAAAGGTTVLDGVDLDLAPGAVLAVAGPSGAGKSTLGLALLGECATGVTLGGSVRVGDTELLGVDRRTLRARRAGRVGHLPQHPGVVLDPVRRTGPVLDELAATVHGRGRAHRAARDRAVAEALDRAGLGAEPQLARRHPHELSGGQQQRMALAQTLVTGPDVVVLDEPTTGLDPVTTRAVIDRLTALAAGGTALVLLTHDLDAVRRLAAALPVELLELADGRVVRTGPAAALLGPASEPDGAPAASGAEAVLEVQDLTVRVGDGVTLLSGADLTVDRGGFVAVAGPSGAGKTTLGRALAGLVGHTGTVRVDGADPAGNRRAVQYVHQDCRSAFLDHRPVLEQVARPAVLLRGLPRADARAEAVALLERLGLDEATAGRRPGGLSGGQLQRASVARALLARPAVLVADEATSALDGEHRARLLDELRRTCRDDGTAVVLISHDPVAVAAADRTVGVVDGRIAAEPAPEPAERR
ncbi:ABC transporter ATP-binding protein [Pseudonocardia phyllosphaerae]|uniref:ABC transporter ATP-binding protein n=1 Tax=Pseudonocardia phyllosphaerae TaxID=3390502 RepID=UPI00397AD9AD